MLDRFHVTYRYAPDSSMLSEGGRLPTETVPIYVDHTEQEIVLGIDLPEPYTVELAADWRTAITDADYLTVETQSDVARLYPEIDLLDEDRQDRVVDILVNDVPDFYWYMPSSTGGSYHPPDEHWLHGQYIHNKRMLGGIVQLSRSGIASTAEIAAITEEEMQDAIEAAFYHDMFKFGSGAEPEEHSVKEHAGHAATYFRDYSDHELGEHIIRCIERHGGPFYKTPEPANAVEHLVHTADMHAADQRSTYALLDPVPEVVFARTVTELQDRNQDEDWGLDAYTVIPDTDTLLDRI